MTDASNAVRPTARTAAGAARIGCSGWEYRDWRNTVYPRGLPASRRFEHYATLFDTVEINATFYRLPAVETVEQWARQAPEGFTYAVKMGQFGSHRMKLRDSARWLPNHLDRVRRLGPARPDARPTPTEVAAQRGAPRRVPHRCAGDHAVGCRAA